MTVLDQWHEVYAQRASVSPQSTKSGRASETEGLFRCCCQTSLTANLIKYLNDSLLHYHRTSTFHFRAVQNYKSQQATRTLQKLKIYNFRYKEFTALFPVANFEFGTVPKLVQPCCCFRITLRSAWCFKANY